MLKRAVETKPAQTVTSAICTSEVEAGRLYAPVVAEQENQLTWRGEVTTAVASYQEALRLDSTLAITPAVEALRQSALVQEIGMGDLLTGTVTGASADLWRFKADAGQTLTISATASVEAFDIVITLYAPDFTELIRQDDNSDGLEVIEGYTLPTTGVYLLNVGAYGDGNGKYTLEVK